MLRQTPLTRHLSMTMPEMTIAMGDCGLTHLERRTRAAEVCTVTSCLHIAPRGCHRRLRRCAAWSLSLRLITPTRVKNSTLAHTGAARTAPTAQTAHHGLRRSLLQLSYRRLQAALCPMLSRESWRPSEKGIAVKQPSGRLNDTSLPMAMVTLPLLRTMHLAWPQRGLLMVTAIAMAMHLALMDASTAVIASLPQLLMMMPQTPEACHMVRVAA